MENPEQKFKTKHNKIQQNRTTLKKIQEPRTNQTTSNNIEPQTIT